MRHPGGPGHRHHGLLTRWNVAAPHQVDPQAPGVATARTRLTGVPHCTSHERHNYHCQKKRPAVKDPVQLDCMAQEEGDAAGRTPSGETLITSNPVYSVFHQVSWEGNFGCKQKEDAQLRHYWGYVHLINGVDQQPEQHLPANYFLVSNDLLGTGANYLTANSEPTTPWTSCGISPSAPAWMPTFGPSASCASSINKQCPNDHRPHPSPHYWRLLREGGHGSGWAAPKVCPGPQIYPCDPQLCHQVPRGSLPLKGHLPDNRQRTCAHVQPGGDPQRHLN